MAVQAVAVLVPILAVAWLVAAASTREVDKADHGTSLPLRAAKAVPARALELARAMTVASRHLAERTATGAVRMRATAARVSSSLPELPKVRLPRRPAAERRAARVQFTDSLLMTVPKPADARGADTGDEESAEVAGRIRGVLGLVLLVALVGAVIAVAVAGTAWGLHHLIRGRTA